MLIQFTVNNYRSFKDEATLSMVAAPIKEHEKENVFQVSGKLSLLKSAVVYGANASGKSNLFMAMNFMKMFVINSSKETQANEKIKVSRFKLNEDGEKNPASFEIIFMYENVRYRYGFALDEERIHAEWLFYVPKKQELKVFTREGQKFNLTSHFKSEEILITNERVRKNALLLSVSAQFNGKIAKKIMEWIFKFNTISSLHSQGHEQVTFDLMNKDGGLYAILELLKDADTGIENLSIDKNKVDINELPRHIQTILKTEKREENLVRVDVKTYHHKYDNKGKIVDSVAFDMGNEESDGTRKFFEMSGLLIDTLKKGSVLVIDEISARLHPRLIEKICKLFNSAKTNPNNAQLIFSSHNTNILRNDLFRRDQVWFVEKNKFGASELYSLVEYKQEDNKKVRNDASYEKDYLMGKYGGVPFIRDFEVF